MGPRPPYNANVTLFKLIDIQTHRTSNTSRHMASKITIKCFKINVFQNTFFWFVSKLKELFNYHNIFSYNGGIIEFLTNVMFDALIKTFCS